MIRQPDISPAKWVYLGTIKKSQFWSCSLKMNHKQCGRGMLFQGLGSGCCKPRVNWRKQKNLKYSDFYWLSSGRLPLSEPLLGKEELFFFSYRNIISCPRCTVGISSVHGVRIVSLSFWLHCK